MHVGTMLPKDFSGIKDPSLLRVLYVD